MPAAAITARVTAPPPTRDAFHGTVQMSDTNTPTAAGKSRVRIARELKGLTQAQLAERVGRHIETVKAWDQGRHKPGSPEDAQQLADVLERPLEWLFPPEEHLYVRDARARFPAPSAQAQAASPEIPDPQDVLATLRPRRPARRVRLAPTLALLATAAAIAAAVALATGSRTTAGPSAKTTPATTLTPAADAVQPPVSAKLSAIGQEQQTDKQTQPTAKRASRHRAAAHRRHRSHRRRGRTRPTRPTYTPPVNATPASRTVTPTATQTAATGGTTSTPGSRQAADPDLAELGP
jgi:transcriptional regulator with XRE-family HTH domain